MIRAAASSSTVMPAVRGAAVDGALAGQLGDQHLTVVADDARIDVLEGQRVGA